MRVNKNQPNFSRGKRDNKSKPAKGGRARAGGKGKDKFRTSYSSQRRGQKITKKDIKQVKRESFRNKRLPKPAEVAEKPKVTHKEQRANLKKQSKQSDAIIKIQVEEGIKKGSSHENLKQIISGVKMRGLKQRLTKRINKHFKFV